MDVSLFDFELPDECIALRPAIPRDGARMMVVHPDGMIEHRHVRDLGGYLNPGDALVVNDTRVLPARLRGHRRRDGSVAKVEILLHRRLDASRYSALARPAKKLSVGDELTFGPLCARVASRGVAGEVELAFACSGEALDASIVQVGEMPLPPYIARMRAVDAQDSLDYQTVFASEQGSVASPTAGLHFTPALLKAIAARGVSQEAVTLHVGLGTFLPVSAEDTSRHRMHSERATVNQDVAARLNAVHAAGARILAAGSTSLRTLESATDASGVLHGFDDETDIFITPGYRFRAVDMVLTNFHLPRSTLFMLVSAFMGLDVMRAAYAEAIRLEYRFYSYGDACLLLKPA